MPAIETLYAGLLVAALALNGIAVAGRTTLATLFAPLREVRLVLPVLAIDLLLVPLIVVPLALLTGLDDGVRAGLVLIAAASAGAIGIALARIVRGDIPLAVSTVVGLGALNLLTVPLLTGLLLPSSVEVSLGALTSSVLLLAVLPLLVGRAFARSPILARRSTEQQERLLKRTGSLSTLLLLAAIMVAATLDARAVLEVLRGPTSAIAAVTMVAIALATRIVTRDPARWRSLVVVLNARAAGLALALAAIHLGTVPAVRATVLAFGGLTQVVPPLLLLAHRGLRALAGR